MQKSILNLQITTFTHFWVKKRTSKKELENATDYILELEEKVYKANKTSLELLKQLKDAEIEIETLKQYIVDLK